MLCCWLLLAAGHALPYGPLAVLLIAWFPSLASSLAALQGVARDLLHDNGDVIEDLFYTGKVTQVMGNPVPTFSREVGVWILDPGSWEGGWWDTRMRVSAGCPRVVGWVPSVVQRPGRRRAGRPRTAPGEYGGETPRLVGAPT